MYIRIVNFPPGITVDAVRDFLGESGDIENILLSDAGDSDDVIAMVKVNTSHTGATAMAEFIDGRFYQERRLSAQAMTLVND